MARPRSTGPCPLPGLGSGEVHDAVRLQREKEEREEEKRRKVELVKRCGSHGRCCATTASTAPLSLTSSRLRSRRRRRRRRQREEVEYEARMQALSRRVFNNEQLTPAESSAWRRWAGHLPSPRRKRKKRKKKLPRGSSWSSST